MSRIHIEHLYRIDLDECVAEYALSEPLMHQDARADVFTAALRRGMTPVDLTGAKATAYIAFAASGQTLTLPGTIDGSSVSVTFDSPCYAVPGAFRMALQLVQGDTRRTILTVTGEIRRTATDQVITGGDVVPTLADLLAQIDAMAQASAEASAAAVLADSAAAETRRATADILVSSAPPIVCEASGSMITVPDGAGGRTLPRLSLMGRTVQAGQPSPDAPLPLVSTPAGTVTVQAAGMNLLDMSNATGHPFVSSIGADGAITIRGSLDVSWGGSYLGSFLMLAGQRYTISAALGYGRLGLSTSPVYTPNAEDYPDTSFGTSVGGLLIAPNTTATFTANETRQVYLWFCTDVLNSGANPAFTTRIMLSPGGSADYTPGCGGSSMQAVLPSALAGIAAASGGNYTDASGQQWICDEANLPQSRLIRRVKVVDAASLPWAYSTVNRLFYTNTPVGADALMCSAYPFIGAYTDWQLPDTDQTLSLYANLGGMRIRDDRFTSVSEFTRALTGVQIAYVLPSPEETDLPSGGQEAIRSVHGSMCIINDAGADMQVGYVADTKLYIDQALAKLSRA